MTKPPSGCELLRVGAFLSLLGLMLTCAMPVTPTLSPTDTPKPTAVATMTPEPMPTLTPLPTITPIPSPLPTITPTPISCRVRTKNVAGQWTLDESHSLPFITLDAQDYVHETAITSETLGRPTLSVDVWRNPAVRNSLSEFVELDRSGPWPQYDDYRHDQVTLKAYLSDHNGVVTHMASFLAEGRHSGIIAVCALCERPGWFDAFDLNPEFDELIELIKQAERNGQYFGLNVDDGEGEKTEAIFDVTGFETAYEDLRICLADYY